MLYQKVQENGYSIQERGLQGNLLIDCFCRENIENNCNISRLECHSTKMFAEYLCWRSTSPTFEDYYFSRLVIIMFNSSLLLLMRQRYHDILTYDIVSFY